MKTLLLAATLASAFASTGAIAAAPNLVTNGSFESITVNSGSWVLSPTLAGWSVLAGPGNFEIRNNVVGVAQDGANFIELDTTGNTTIGQGFTDLTVGGSYALSFWYAPRANVAAASNGIDVLWNGQQLGTTLTGNGGSNPAWTQFSFNVSALAGANTLSFRAVGTSDSLGGSLDNVSLTSAVPEPSGYALLLAGLGAIGLVARRRGIAR